MATIRFGGGVVDARGSIAGNTFSRNANGAYQRARVAPTNPGTIDQSEVRNAFSEVTQHWRDLTEAQRQAWIDAAETQQGAYTDRVGQQQQYSGQQLYMAVNQRIQAWLRGGGSSAGSDTGDEPPPLAPAPSAIDFGVMVATTGVGGDLDALGVAINSADATNELLVYASAPVSAGVMRPASVNFKLIGAYEDLTAAGDLDVLSDYTAVFGAAVNDGDKIFLKLVRISDVSWREAAAEVKAAIIAPSS